VFSADQTVKFQDAWARFDPDATGFIDIGELEELL